jgi:hypothetical protein
MKKSLRSYLNTVYQDSKFDKKYGIKQVLMPKVTPMIFPYGCAVSFLAMITKLWSKL